MAFKLSATSSTSLLSLTRLTLKTCAACLVFLRNATEMATSFRQRSICVLLVVLSAALASVNALNGFLDQFPKQNTMLTLSGVGNAPEGNPYGMAVVPLNKGKLQKGHILITNWNDANGKFGKLLARSALCICFLRVGAKLMEFSQSLRQPCTSVLLPADASY